MDHPKILLTGDSALTIEFGAAIDPLINRRVQTLYKKLKTDPPSGVIDLIPTYRSLLIQYDPISLSDEHLRKIISSLMDEAEGLVKEAARIVEVPVCYGKGFGLDLEEVAAYHQLTVDDVIRIHSQSTYQVYMIGFTPGFPFMGGLDKRLLTPRKKIPREIVPAGTVGLAGQQTGIYPIESPGGWQLIGRTPIKLFDLCLGDPFYLKPGDQVIFKPISKEEFEDY